MDPKYVHASKAEQAMRIDEFQTEISAAGITRIALGFQPLGITMRGDMIAIADYFAPAVLLARVEITPKSIRFRDGQWIAGTIAQDGRHVRMFEDVLELGGANRMTSCLIYSADHLGLIRNGERVIHHIKRSGSEWHLDGKYDLDRSGFDRVDAASLCSNGSLLTIESDTASTTWARCRYDRCDSLVEKSDLPPYRYGIAQCGVNDPIFTVADNRAHRVGIFSDKTRIVRNVNGNGIISLSEIDPERPAFLVTCYGQGTGSLFKGEPGTLSYVPLPR